MSTQAPTPYCPHCGYNLTGLPENRCPECGETFDLLVLERLTSPQPITASELLIWFGWPAVLCSGLMIAHGILAVAGWLALLLLGLPHAWDLADRLIWVRAARAGKPPWERPNRWRALPLGLVLHLSRTAAAVVAAFLALRIVCS